MSRWRKVQFAKAVNTEECSKAQAVVHIMLDSKIEIIQLYHPDGVNV
jgi:hypothetical protein